MEGILNGRYDVTSEEVYREVLDINGDVPDHIYVESTSVQEIWVSRSEGRSGIVTREDVEELVERGAVSPSN